MWILQLLLYFPFQVFLLVLRLKRSCTALHNTLHGYTQCENADCTYCIQNDAVGGLLSLVLDGSRAGPMLCHYASCLYLLHCSKTQIHIMFILLHLTYPFSVFLFAYYFQKFNCAWKNFRFSLHKSQQQNPFLCMTYQICKIKRKKKKKKWIVKQWITTALDQSMLG